MKSLRYTLALLPCLAASFLAPTARATTISGVAYCNTSAADASNTPAPGQVHTGTACATFTSASINFNNYGANTLGSFITSDADATSISYLNGYTALSNLDYSFFTFSGLAYFTQGQTYSATHDDGTVMMVGNATVINSPAPTAPITSTFVFSNPTGNYNFQYDYTEQLGGSTYATNATASPVPEPESLALCGTGALFVIGLARKRLTSHGASAPTAA